MMGKWSQCKMQLDRARRFFLTAFLYFMFAIGALTVSLLMVAPVVVILRNRKHRIKCVRWINRIAFRVFIRFAGILGVFDVSFINIRQLEQPGQLIIANHPSLLDVVFILAQIPNANCVVKNALLKNPFLAVPIYFADYIRNEKEEGFLKSCVASINRGESLIIFPEGTRTVRGQRYKFKRGTARLMLMSDCPVRPIHISCVPSALGKKTPWYAIPDRKVTYCLTVMPELDMLLVRQASHVKMSLKSRRLTKWLVDRYEALDTETSCNSLGRVLLPL